jgi:hypothetical protein
MAELEDLLVSGTELDKKLVAEVLSLYVQLDKDTCTIRPTERWTALSNEHKILVYLLARKAMVALGLDLTTEGATASEVIAETGVKSGTVHPALRKLLGNRLIDQSQDKRYSVPNYAIARIKSLVSENK